VCALLPYDPSACGCCACSGFSEYQARGARARSAFVSAFVAFGGEDGPPWANLRYFKTQSARGLALSADGVGGFYFKRYAVACTFRGENTRAGASLVQSWAQGDAAWDDASGAFVEYDTPSEATTCSGNPTHFSELEAMGTAEFLAANRARAKYRPAGDQFLPLGESYLANEYNAAAWLALGRALAADPTPEAAWGAVVDGESAGRVAESIHGAPLASYTWSHEIERQRWYFPIPAAGWGVRVRFSVYWEPEGGAAQLFDQVVLEWDRATPAGYDPADDATWPRSPWYEMPEPAAAGRYYLAGVALECGPTPTPTAPGTVSVDLL
jgi:hypothetical protein